MQTAHIMTQKVHVMTSAGCPAPARVLTQETPLWVTYKWGGCYGQKTQTQMQTHNVIWFYCALLVLSFSICWVRAVRTQSWRGRNPDRFSIFQGRKWLSPRQMRTKMKELSTWKTTQLDCGPQFHHLLFRSLLGGKDKRLLSSLYLYSVPLLSLSKAVITAFSLAAFRIS